MKHFSIVMLCLWLGACGKSPAPAPTAAETAASDSAKDSAKPLQVTMSEEMLRRGDISTEAAVMQTSRNAREYSGRLAPNAERTWTVGTVSEGRVLELNVAVGDRVRKGQVLARIHSHDVHEGRGDYSKAQAERQRAVSNLDYAKRNRDRLRRLLEMKAASSMQVEEAEAEVKRAEATIATSAAELQRAKLHLEEFLEVPAEPSAKAAANPDHPENLLQVRAPEAGLVVEKLTAVGSLVKANEPMLRLTDTATLWMIAAVPEEALQQVKIGATATIRLDAFPDQSFTGKVAMLGNELDRETRTVQVRLVIANTGNRLLPEMYGKASFGAGETAQVLRVPQAAVHDLDGIAVVFVETGKGTFAPRPVDLGEASQGLVTVRGGVQPGERVVTKGAYVVKSQLLKARLAEE